MGKISEPLSKVAAKIGSIKFIMAFAETMQLLTPIMIVGAFGCLFYSFPIDAWQDFLAANQILFNVGAKIHMCALYILGLFILVVFPHRYASRLGFKNPLSVVIVVMLTYLVLTPMEYFTSIPVTWIAQQGIFSIIIITLIVVNFMKFLDDKNVKIKMPESVPQYVSDGFASLISASIIVTIAAVLGAYMETTSFGCIHQLFYSLIQYPIQGLVSSTFFGMLFMYFFASTFYFFGIHSSTVQGLVQPVLTSASLTQLAAWTAGEELPYIPVGGFTWLILFTSAIYASLALVLFCKSKRYKSIGKFALIPSLFGISEPITYGAPLMLNPYIFIPYVLTPIINYTISYFAIASGLVGRFTGIEGSFIIPFFFNQLLTSSTPIKAGILQVILLVIDLALWYPFVKVMDNDALKEEQS